MPKKENFTVDRISAFKCPAGKHQSIYWDGKTPGLGLRVTAGGAKSYIFETRLHGKTLRVTIGDVRTWTVAKAQKEATDLKAMTDKGVDPRHQKAEQRAKAEATRQEELRQDVTFGEAWAAYVEARKAKWSSSHADAHLKAISGKDKPGPLAEFIPLKLSAITAEVVQNWIKKNIATRPTFTTVCFRKLRAFLNWCADQSEFADLAPPDVCRRKVVREYLPRNKAKTDCLQREQLKAWFAAVTGLSNPVLSAYLQILLLTGARREELATLCWENVDLKWGAMTIKDKVEEERTIPMTPYVAALLRRLKARNETPPPCHRILHGKRIDNDLKNWKPSPWVFASPTAESGRIVEPRIAHNRALAAADLPALTLHGLRRSFGTLAEWVEAPTGVVAQIMGHKPSALAEKHYRQRPLDLLRMWHTKIEAWLLEQAGIEFDVSQQPHELRVVTH